jgi:hypothetical protein
VRRYTKTQATTVGEFTSREPKDGVRLMIDSAAWLILIPIVILLVAVMRA